MYVCTECGKPVERTIEGELICEDCYAMSDMSPEEIKWQRHHVTHCQVCDVETGHPGLCTKCRKEETEYQQSVNCGICGAYTGQPGFCDKCWQVHGHQNGEEKKEATFSYSDYSSIPTQLETTAQNILDIANRMLQAPIINDEEAETLINRQYDL